MPQLIFTYFSPLLRRRFSYAAGLEQSHFPTKIFHWGRHAFLKRKTCRPQLQTVHVLAKSFTAFSASWLDGDSSTTL